MSLNLEKISPWNWFKKEGDNKELAISDKPSKLSTPLLQLHQEIDRVFNDFLPSQWPSMGQKDGWSDSVRAFKPQVDINKLDDKYHIEVDVPGVDKKDIKIEVLDDTLRISGDKCTNKEESKDNYHRIERSYGAFQRTLVLPENADKEDIKVHYKDGVLKIDINKDADIRVEPLIRQIEIQ